jgi:hypothetical protein
MPCMRSPARRPDNRRLPETGISSAISSPRLEFPARFLSRCPRCPQASSAASLALCDALCSNDEGWGAAMKWATERDNLIAQTRAFVQSVTSPYVETTTATVAIRPLENPFAVAKAAPAEHVASIKLIEKAVPVENVTPIEKSAPIEKANGPANMLMPVAMPSIRMVPQSEARKEIQNRIAAFQAHQARFHRERDAYFNSVLTKARATADGSTIDSGPKAPSA